ncbi:hypothetical protein BH09VER1_BH09VER1_03880 [soil metagenome]
MKARPRHHSRPTLGSAAPRGSALVIILAFVVLATVLVLAFFSRSILERQMSNASANQTKVDILAHSAIDTIVGDFKQEIAAGSTATNVGPATNQTTLYFPISPTNMIPARSGNPTFSGSPTNDPIPNLIRRSVRSDPLVVSGYIGVSASAAGSTNLSANGRSVSPARWNSHYLIPRLNAGSTAIDTTPTNSFVAPDWVMVTSNGPATITTPSSAVIGRYAYAIYDEGGLLDANLAGFPSSLTNYPNAATNVVSYKGSAALADLAAIGITNVDNLIGWRNYATVKPTSGSLGSFNFQGDANVASNYYQYLTNGTNSGGLTVSTNSFNGHTDQMFTSRQALLKFRRATGLPQDALQYLGTFSRDLEQPSFQPDPTRPKNTTHDWATAAKTTPGFGGNNTYDPTGATQDLVNPFLLAARNANGDPVMKRRFPLSRLALVKPNPSSFDATFILNYFGLKWSTDHWIYDHGNPSQILKLSEIPSTREPDFFETLKAAINCDSIGKQYGGTEGSSGALYSPHQYVGNAAAIDGIINYQIIQIGANLIDQYDEDSYPTHITYTGHEFYGVENIPYLNGWMMSWYRMKQLSAADIDPARQPPPAADGSLVYPYQTWAMFQPIIWNPHAPNSNLNTSLVPTKFRVAAGNVAGQGLPVTISPVVRPSWWTSGGVTTFPATAGFTSAVWSQATLNPSTSLLNFDATPNTANNLAASAFQEPYRLLYHYPAGSNADADTNYSVGRFSLDALGSIADPVLATSDATSDGKTVIGFFAGKCWTGPYAATGTFSGTNDPPNCLVGGYSSDNIQLILQYQDALGAWQTYDVINQVYASSVSGALMSTVDNADSGTNLRGFITSFRADPRTDRWGLFSMKTFPLASNPSGVSKAPSDGIYGNTSIVYNYPQGTTLSPNAGVNSGVVYFLNRNSAGTPLVDWSTSPYLSDLAVNLNTGSSSSYIPGKKFYYNDPDHVLRRASGAIFSGSNGLPMATGNFDSRPVVLDRPFRSVAEMGYAFSDTPWKDVNFVMPESGDSALLDAFCLNKLNNSTGDVTVAGRVDLNTRQPKVLQALIQGAAKADGVIISNTDAANAALALINWTADTTSANSGILTRGPLRNRSELVGKFIKAVTYSSPPSSNTPNIGYDGALSYSGYSSLLTNPAVFSDATTGPKDASVKRRRESVMRALVDSGNTRTWNLFIDVIAQTGRFPASATSLDQFTVEGETRYWIHVAIDRFTGKVIAKQLESVTE